MQHSTRPQAEGLEARLQLLGQDMCGAHSVVCDEGVVCMCECDLFVLVHYLVVARCVVGVYVCVSRLCLGHV